MTPYLLSFLLALPVQQVQAKPPVVRDQRTVQAPQPAGKGVMAGVVVSADAGRPVRRARVTLAGGSPRVGKSVQTDDQGAFRFEELSAGDYTLTTSKPGYVETVFGQKHPGSGRPGTPIRLATDQQLTKISMPLARGAVITGAVFDETGEPVFGINVRLYRWVMSSGSRTLESWGTASSDDRGIYRFPALQPGDYLVSTIQQEDGEFVAFTKVGDGLKLKLDLDKIDKATLYGDVMVAVSKADSMAAATTGFASVYFPGTTDVSSAATLSVAIGEERSGVDFHLQVVPIGKVGGMVMGPDGPAAGAEVQLVNRSQPPGIGIRSARSGKDGRFSFVGIPPGQYLLFARATPKGGQPLDASPREAAEFLASQAADEKKRAAIAGAMAAAAQLWGMAEVSSDGRDVIDVPVTLQPGATVQGRVVFESSTGAPPSAARLTMTLAMVGPHVTGDRIEPPPAAVDANGQFTIRGVFPGRYRLAVAGGAPSGYTLKSAVFGGQDVLDLPFELTGVERPAGGLVTFGTRTTEISGTVNDASSQPAPGATIIAFSSDERFWTPESRRIRAIRPAADGKYTLKDLPPGDYRLIALSDVETGRWFDPAFLRTLSTATLFSVAEGSKLTLDIKVQ